MNKQLKIYDTTLRDGAQYKGISFSLQDKLKITRLLDDFGVDYIEGGWPGSNPKDKDYFEALKLSPLKKATLVAFGATRKPHTDVHADPQVQSLLNAETPAVALVSKCWSFHVESVLNTDREENLNMIFDSVQFFKRHNKEVILDAEHFFDGFKDNPGYAFQCLEAAIKAEVDNVSLCDTNGGTMPHEIFEITAKTRQRFPQLKLGIHCHNDCELAVANSLQSLHAGVELVQGTINGYGERCGNANLVTLMGTLSLKSTFSDRFSLNRRIDPGELTTIATAISNIANLPLKPDAAYVGQHAFSHKGGIHVAAIAKAAKTYEHIDPKLAGNHRDITISELSGKSNIKLQAKKLGLDVSRNFSEILNSIKLLEQTGLTLENATGSFEMLVRKHDKKFKPHFSVVNIHVNTCDFHDSTQLCNATVKLKVSNQESHVVADARGPVDALNVALRKALLEFYPQVQQMKLTDYKVSIINPEKASAATTRVWIQSGSGGTRWSTIGCSDNIINASTQALIDSYQLFLIKHQHTQSQEKEVLQHGNLERT